MDPYTTPEHKFATLSAQRYRLLPDTSLTRGCNYPYMCDSLGYYGLEWMHLLNTSFSYMLHEHIGIIGAQASFSIRPEMQCYRLSPGTYLGQGCNSPYMCDSLGRGVDEQMHLNQQKLLLHVAWTHRPHRTTSWLLCWPCNAIAHGLTHTPP